MVEIIKFILFTFAVTFTLIFINYKISKIARIIAYKENETEKESKISFIILIITSFFWSFYLYF